MAQFSTDSDMAAKLRQDSCEANSEALLAEIGGIDNLRQYAIGVFGRDNDASIDVLKASCEANSEQFLADIGGIDNLDTYLDDSMDNLRKVSCQINLANFLDEIGGIDNLERYALEVTSLPQEDEIAEPAELELVEWLESMNEVGCCDSTRTA